MEKEKVTLEDAIEHGLKENEFEDICKILGRIPNSTELGIFSGMWSEHCSYKNSILKLKTLPTESSLMLTTTGEENAGALDIGDGLGVVFKIESHNHPTAVEPYQGAATGVGGIMRDIFTMGARPFISLNSLRFGLPDVKRNEYLLKRAVKGIADYGNSLGIAVSGGELFFDSSFSKNPLVNAMTVGVVKKNGMAKATTGGKVGHSVFIVGATTGRDGIHGASFASKDLSKESEEKKSAVQVGDPFMEKLLMEATLEAIEKDILVGIQDMGAAGISCSTSEMSAKGKTGMEIDLDKVPFRETGMNAYEAMLSESQERMLVVPKKGKEEELVAIFKKWDLNAVEIGVVTEDGMLRVKKDGKVKAEIPSDTLVLGGGAPRYVREEKRPNYLDEVTKLDISGIQDITAANIGKTLDQMLSNLNICSRKPLYEQYDTDVGLVEVIGPGLDGGLARVPGTNKGIAVSTDCNSRYTYLDPYKGAIWAVCESARNVFVTGAKPIGITNNLNFANPYIPENYYVFSECVKGIGDACRFLKLPVTGGNVSFYNESPEGPVFPTPTIGMVGLIPDITHHIKNYFQKPNETIAIVGRFKPTLGGSEFLKEFHNLTKGNIPELSLEDEMNLQNLILSLNQDRLISSAKDISLGGILVALSKMAFPKKVGANIDLSSIKKTRLDETLFGETAASVVITFPTQNFDQIESICQKNKLEIYNIGKTKATPSIELGELYYEGDLGHLIEKYESRLVSVFE
ncbi:MAG TPA: phosphoribosylformylglycinamidine synthase subunit PurL [Leptospiraceae bacterium]|nr:phosphoribosylformylglycinamidine synthase subunit PurL [Leptospiraceae bacterium]HMW04699.1 phosphoribosylformylglycinamidine synthase subunit PurL [Leptospiraceae bacterium]HMX31730.1 phosphoribosylformylglycinamidine synthase subunit PurL [Leptospiraceae bacterium]HMY30536.1 phosphoribosylformylglycinamidine synthase subunit PurL [Leptospiraceae bacterium]HMZ64163.1 phosphoribosylformylglycinamidine synthase subunit PurL [Leptospiraceae bacterium]